MFSPAEVVSSKRAFGAMLMFCKHLIRSLLCLFVLLCAACPTARADDLLRDKVTPFMQAYCVRCHNDKKSEGLLNLTRYTTNAHIARDFREWEHVITFLKEEKM